MLELMYGRMALVNNSWFTRSLLCILSWLCFCGYKVLRWFRPTAFNEMMLLLCVVGQVQRGYGDCTGNMNNMARN